MPKTSNRGSSPHCKKCPKSEYLRPDRTIAALMSVVTLTECVFTLFNYSRACPDCICTKHWTWKAVLVRDVALRAHLPTATFLSIEILGPALVAMSTGSPSESETIIGSIFRLQRGE